MARPKAAGPNEPPAHAVEYYVQVFDYLKHLTTLSTGSIILIATFLEKLFLHPRWKPLVVVALAGFMTCVISSIIVHSLMLFVDFPGKRKGKDPKWVEGVGVFSFIFAWSGFLVGVVSLAVFAMRNLVAPYQGCG